MNKMDRIKWSAERFSSIRKRLGEYLEHIGFSVESIIWVPISAITAENITPKNKVPFEAEGF